MAKQKLRALTKARKSPANLPIDPEMPLSLDGMLKAAKGVGDLYAVWELARAATEALCIFCPDDSHADLRNRLDKTEDAAVFGMIKTEAEYIQDISYKLDVYRALMRIGDWADARDQQMLDSADRDCWSALLDKYEARDRERLERVAKMQAAGGAK